MAEDNPDNTTFVSIDGFAPSQSSVGAPNPRTSLVDDTTSLTELLQEDESMINLDDTLDPPDSSMRYSTSNRPSAEFMWTFTGDETAEDTCQTSEQEDEEPADEDDHHPILDEADVCGNFDTATLSAIPYDQSPYPASSSSLPPSDRRSSGPNPSSYAPTSPADLRRRMSVPKCATPSSHSAVINTPCSNSKPPLPPAQQSSASPVSSVQASYRSSSHVPMHSEHSSQEHSSPCQPLTSGDDPMVDMQIAEAAHGLSSSAISNPFPISPDCVGGNETIHLFSSITDLGEKEQKAINEFANVQDSPNYRVVKGLIETIDFQRLQIENMKESEVNLANLAYDKNIRRYSEAAQHKDYAVNALVSEVDFHQTKVTQLEEENQRLKNMLQDSNGKIGQIEQYYQQFIGGFKLAGDIVPALEKASNEAGQVRRMSVEAVEQKDVQIEDFAQRLLNMGNLLSESRKRTERIEKENSELRDVVRQLDAEEPLGSVENIIDSPDTKTRTVTTPSKEHIEQISDLKQEIKEQNAELENFQTLYEQKESQRKKTQEAFLTMNIDLENERSKCRTLQEQRDSAETKSRELAAAASEEKRRFVKVGKEWCESIVRAYSELDERESEIRVLRRELDDRENAFRAVQCTNQDLDQQLQALSEAACNRDRSKNSNSVSAGVGETLVETVISNLQQELEKAQSLLHERSMQHDVLKKALVEQDEVNIALQKQCSRLNAAAAVRRRSGSESSPREANSSSMSDEDRFLRRLSEKLGCKSDSSRDLIEQLAKRVESLMVERSELENLSETMRADIAERESMLHKVRSEMQAEISSLKAEVAHLENMRSRAQEDMKASEARLLELYGVEGTQSRRESFADLTVSSVGTRAWLVGEEGEASSRRGSILSTAGADDTLRWSDPIIDAAVQSVSALIGTKDSLAARNRELRDKLQGYINGLSTMDDDGNLRTIMIQSKELQEELTGVVGMQQDIIGRLAQSNPNITQTLSNAGEDTLPLIRHLPEGTTLCSASEDTEEVNKSQFGEATRFLNEQLTSTRAMYSEKMKANVELCGMVDELQEELKFVKLSNSNIENALKKLQETHQGFLSRLAEIVGADRSMISVEDFFRASRNDLTTMQSELERKEAEERVTTRRSFSLIVQKRFLAYIIGIYQSRYKLNIMARTDEEKNSLKRRLRIHVHAIVALKRFSKLIKVESDAKLDDVQDVFEVPVEIDITKVDGDEIGLLDASLAISSVPRFEEAVARKDLEIQRLESSIEALNRSMASRQQSSSHIFGDLPKSSYAYDEDVMHRKNDLSRRVEKILREKEQIEDQLSKEKKYRLNAEAKTARYMEKVSTYKKRLGKLSAHAESKESAYKSAIRYLKNKADKAISNGFNLEDENSAPMEVSGGVNDTPEDVTRLMASQLEQAETQLMEMTSGSPEHERMKTFVNGLRMAMHRVERPSVLRRVPDNTGNREALAN